MLEVNKTNKETKRNAIGFPVGYNLEETILVLD